MQHIHEYNKNKLLAVWYLFHEDWFHEDWSTLPGFRGGQIGELLELLGAELAEVSEEEDE